MTWESLDWEILDRLRENFLSGAAANGPYWHTLTDLECYDFTYGERIGCKWDAVLRELKLRSWTPPAQTTILDWGCGSGVAGRRVVDFFGAAKFSRLLVHDHSALAVDYAEHHGRKAFPSLPVERANPRMLAGEEPIGVLVLSHVLNELHDTDLTGLGKLMSRAGAILWLEPGNHEVSRVLGHWRKKLAGPFHVVAPCPHQAACGMLATGNERHWCHFFATPPAGIYADSGWVKFGQRAGIDLRSLPYSFLALERQTVAAVYDRRARDADGPYESADAGEDVGDNPRPTADGGHRPPLQGLSRIIGEPRHYKGYAKIFNCDVGGVSELMLQKRDAPALFKALKHGGDATLHRWTHENGRIIRIEPDSTTIEHQ